MMHTRPHTRPLFRGALIVVLLLSSRLLQGQQLVTLSSPLIPGTDSIWVFAPSGHAASEGPLPVLYLLHGYAGSYRQWNNIIRLQPLADRFGFLIVCPDAFFNAWYLNSPLKKDHQYARFFFERLMPAINRRFPVDTEKVFIDGLSMGGYGALHLFLSDPAKFRSAGSISGVVDLRGAGNHFGLPDLLGPLESHQDLWKEEAVAGNLYKLDSTGKKFIDDCGWSDPFFRMNEALRRECDSLKLDGTFVSRPGGHTAAYWRGALPMHLFFFSEQLRSAKQASRQ